jgi:hypothetical protein
VVGPTPSHAPKKSIQTKQWNWRWGPYFHHPMRNRKFISVDSTEKKKKSEKDRKGIITRLAVARWHQHRMILINIRRNCGCKRSAFTQLFIPVERLPSGFSKITIEHGHRNWLVADLPIFSMVIFQFANSKRLQCLGEDLQTSHAVSTNRSLVVAIYKLISFLWCTHVCTNPVEPKVYLYRFIIVYPTEFELK